MFSNSLTADDLDLDVVREIEDGEIFKVLQQRIVKDLLLSLEESKDENIINHWKSNTADFLEKCDSTEKELEFFAIGVASLLLFVQQNWTGPDFDIRELSILKYEDDVVLAKQRLSIYQELLMDGEGIVSVVQYPELLLLSRLIIGECYKKIHKRITKLWYLRSLFIHQQILEETSPNLFDMINNVINEMKTEAFDNSNADKAKLEIDKALECSGLQTYLTGALGKRTKFQQEDLAQLTLKVDISSSAKPYSDRNNEVDLPIDIKLEDEVRLNRIKFKNDLDGKNPNLSGLQQAIILGVFCQTQKSQPMDNLAEEELQALASCILDKPKLWSVKLTTLLFRSKLESNNKRSVERAMMQIQTLVDSINSEKPSVKERLTYFFISFQPPRWQIESSLANIMMCMGAFKSALDIYLRLEDWENVIHCYSLLGMHQKAKEIIEQELKKNPTPKLWCYLGDATGDVSHYETAWKLSNERSARAQRHWAMFYYGRREYDKSIEHFELSLEKNSLQSELWYRLGYAALHEEKWEVSARAYRRYCVLDSECFEAWNNLARCYCELNQKKRAWRALQEALKVDYSNWRVWDNYMLVSSDLREFDEVVRSYHQLLNLKEKHVDIPILKTLVLGFKEAESEATKIEESEEKDTTVKALNKFKDKLLTLFGRLTSQVVGLPELWYLYSQIVPSESPQDKLKRQQLLLKAYNATVNKNTWVKTIDSCKNVMELVYELIDASISVEQKSVLVSCQMSVRSFITLVKKEYPGTDICDELEKRMLKLEEEIEKYLLNTI